MMPLVLIAKHQNTFIRHTPTQNACISLGQTARGRVKRGKSRLTGGGGTRASTYIHICFPRNEQKMQSPRQEAKDFTGEITRCYLRGIETY